MKKNSIIQFICVVIYILVIISGMVILPIIAKKDAFPYVFYSLLGFIIIGLIVIILLKKKMSVYICPICHEDVYLNFGQALVNFASNNKEIKLYCKKCQNTNYMKEK